MGAFVAVLIKLTPAVIGIGFETTAHDQIFVGPHAGAD
jgi:hypothetical protein